VKKLRVSFIEFLNALPLGWGFLYGKHKETFDLLFDVPSECSRHLSTGEADVGLIPVIEYQRIDGLKVIPDISISTQKEARSVLFVSRKPIGQVKTIALDTSSRTSVALLKILMSEFYGCDAIQYIDSEPNLDQMLNRCDAALVIGNPALKIRAQQIPFIYDLAAEWFRFTGLPFVFAFWAINQNIEISSQVQIFLDSRNEGLLKLEEIANNYSPKLQISKAEIISYLSENLDYTLDGKNQQGLKLFFELSEKHLLIPECKPIEFVDPYR